MPYNIPYFMTNMAIIVYLYCKRNVYGDGAGVEQGTGLELNIGVSPCGVYLHRWTWRDGAWSEQGTGLYSGVAPSLLSGVMQT